MSAFLEARRAEVVRLILQGSQLEALHYAVGKTKRSKAFKSATLRIHNPCILVVQDGDSVHGGPGSDLCRQTCSGPEATYLLPAGRMR